MNNSIFSEYASQNKNLQPLAKRIRPENLSNYIFSFVNKKDEEFLRKNISNKNLCSIILSGPPGSGKTTLANVIVNSLSIRSEVINAALSTLTDIKSIVEKAQEIKTLYNSKLLLFIDEIHRLNKMCQDALLASVENGEILLIGATTENPFFTISNALLSRCKVLTIKKLSNENIVNILNKALADNINGYGNYKIELEDDCLYLIADCAKGDARVALNTLERCVESAIIEYSGENIIKLNKVFVEKYIDDGVLLYDKNGSEHYNTISAFIKSLRGSDPDAALFYLFYMLERGEDPVFLFRRMLIFAAEDVGLADPFAIGIITSLEQAFTLVGLPEGQYHLSMAALYLSLTNKSNSVGAFFEAKKYVKNNYNPPDYLINNIPASKNYKYPHNYPFAYAIQEYLPKELQGSEFYRPNENGFEKKLKDLYLFRKSLKNN